MGGDDHDEPDETRPAVPDVRVGDTDRQAAMDALGTHLEAGRLDVEEFGDRSARASVAVRRSELAALFADLPAPHPTLPLAPHELPAPAATPAPTPPARFRPGMHPALVPLVGLMVLAAFVLPLVMEVAGGVFGAAGAGGGGLVVLPLILVLLARAHHGRRGGWHGPRGHR